MSSFKFLSRVVTVSCNLWLLVILICDVEQCRPPDLSVVTFWRWSAASWTLCKFIPTGHCICLNGGVQLNWKREHTGTWSATAWPPSYVCYHQQYLSVTFIALRFHCHNEKFGVNLKNVIALILLLSVKFVNLKLCNLKSCKLGRACALLKWQKIIDGGSILIS